MQKRLVVKLYHAVFGSRSQLDVKPAEPAQLASPSTQPPAAVLPEKNRPGGCTTVSGQALVHVSEEAIRATPGLHAIPSAEGAPELAVRAGGQGVVFEVRVAADYGVCIPKAVDDFRARLGRMTRAVADLGPQQINVDVADLRLGTTL